MLLPIHGENTVWEPVVKKELSEFILDTIGEDWRLNFKDSSNIGRMAAAMGGRIRKSLDLSRHPASASGTEEEVRQEHAPAASAAPKKERTRSEGQGFRRSPSSAPPGRLNWITAVSVPLVRDGARPDFLYSEIVVRNPG